MAIRVNLNPLGETAAFLYLRRTVKYNTSDWAALYSNLRKSQGIWGMVAKVLGNTKALIKSQLVMYKAVFKVMLFYGK